MRMANKAKTENKSDSEPKKVSPIGNAIGWIVGFILIFVGLLSFIGGWFGGIFLLIAGVIIVPPLNEMIEKITKTKINGLKKFGLVVLFLIVGMVLFPASGTRDVVSNNTSGVVPNSGVVPKQSDAPKLPEPTIEELKTSAVDVNYDDFFRYNENYVGKIIHFKKVQLFQSIDSGTRFLALATNYEPGYNWSWKDTIHIIEYSGPRLLEQDEVEVYGKATGLYEYQTTNGDAETVPEIKAIEITLIKKAS